MPAFTRSRRMSRSNSAKTATFRSWKSGDAPLDALDVLREIHANGPRKFPAHPPMAFLSPTWRKLVRTPSGVDRSAYEVAIMMTLRDRLQAGDVWVEGSRAFRAFDDFLLPPDVFATRRRDGELGLAVADRFEDWRDEETKLLETRLHEVDALAAAGGIQTHFGVGDDCRLDAVCELVTRRLTTGISPEDRRKRQTSIATSAKPTEDPCGLAKETALAMPMGWYFGRCEVPGAQSRGPTAVGFQHMLELRLVDKKRIARTAANRRSLAAPLHFLSSFR